MDRRNFIKLGGIAGACAITPGGVVQGMPHSAFTSLINDTSSRVLVIIQLGGGNDGLNTVLPISQYDNLHAVRPDIMVPQNQLLESGDFGFHPKAAGLRNMYDAGRLSILQNVGYPNVNGSHFRSRDVWSSAILDQTSTFSGWMGRYFAEELPGYPTGYPNAAFPDPPAISISSSAHDTCQGPIFNFAQTTNAHVNVETVGSLSDGILVDDDYGEQIEYLRIIAEQTNNYGQSIQNSYDIAGDSPDHDYPGNSFGSGLRAIARLIGGGLTTKVYTLQLGGFDTHANQVIARTANGTQADLLETLSEGLQTFQDDLSARGHSERVLGLVYSEFGRRVDANGSTGTDHGKANLMFLFGDCLSQGVYGNAPQIDPEPGAYQVLDTEIDFRDIYGSILQDWFEVNDANLIRRLLYQDYTYYPIASCISSRGLPLDIFNFAVQGNKNRAILTWSTSHEIDVDHLRLEHSIDGVIFREVDRFAPLGNDSAGVNEYHATNGPIQRSSTHYYRIKAVDYDGASTFSTIVTLLPEADDLKKWRVGAPYPNPASENFRCELYTPKDEQIKVDCLDPVGRRLFSRQIMNIGGRSSAVNFSVADIPAGTYWLRFRGADDRMINRKLIVQR